MKKQLRNKRGITLIALVVTIIVLLILAGVTIVTLTGENGLLEKARLAKEKTVEAEQDEKDKISSYEDEIDKYNTWERTGGSEIPEGYVLPSGTYDITANGEYNISQYEKVNVNVADEYSNKTYTQEGLTIYDNRITIINGGYCVGDNGTTWVNITFKINIDIGNSDERLLIYGFPNLNGSRIFSDVDGKAPFRVGSWLENSSYKNRIDLSNDYYGSVTANTEFTLQFKY